MLGRQATAEQLFYDFRLDDHVPADHLLRQIDRFVDLEGIRQELKPCTDRRPDRFASDGACQPHGRHQPRAKDRLLGIGRRRRLRGSAAARPCARDFGRTPWTSTFSRHTRRIAGRARTAAGDRPGARRERDRSTERSEEPCRSAGPRTHGPQKSFGLVDEHLHFLPACRSEAPKVGHAMPDLRREARAGGEARKIIAGRPSPLPGIAFRAPTPFAQSLRRAADLRRDRKIAAHCDG